MPNRLGTKIRSGSGVSALEQFIPLWWLFWRKQDSFLHSWGISFDHQFHPASQREWQGATKVQHNRLLSPQMTVKKKKSITFLKILKIWSYWPWQVQATGTFPVAVSNWNHCAPVMKQFHTTYALQCQSNSLQPTQVGKVQHAVRSFVFPRGDFWAVWESISKPLLEFRENCQYVTDTYPLWPANHNSEHLLYTYCVLTILEFIIKSNKRFQPSVVTCLESVTQTTTWWVTTADIHQPNRYLSIFKDVL